MRRILVVEDNPVSAEILSLFLMQIDGMTVETVGCAAVARQRLATAEKYDAVISDVHLPGEDGISLARDIPRLAGRAGLPVIIVTSDGNEQIRKRAEAAGVRAFLTKPWSPGQFRETINSILNGISV